MFNPNIAVKKVATMPSVHGALNLLARVLLAYLFLMSGWGKITSYEGTERYMEMMGISGWLLPLAIVLEVGGAVALLVGFYTRIAALVLAVFSVLTAFIFHTNGVTPAEVVNNSIHFMKNMAMAGGFLFLVLHGAGQFSIDAVIEK